MELGAPCKAKNPDCGKCPFASVCKALRRKEHRNVSAEKEKRAEKAGQGVIAVIESADGKILAVNGAPPFLKTSGRSPL